MAGDLLDDDTCRLSGTWWPSKPPILGGVINLKKKVLLSVAAMCASSAVLAADMSQTINPLNDATRIMDRCAAIAHKISSTKVPPGHPEALAAAFHNEEMAKAHATASPGKPLAPEHLKAVAPDHQAFFKMIQAERAELNKCGEDYARVHKPTHALMKKAGDDMEKNPAKSASEDDKKVAAAMMTYSKSSESLAVAIASLSKDVNHQRYVAPVINKYFLGRD